MWIQDFVYNTLNKLIKTRFYTALMTLAHGDLEYRIMRINQFNLSTAKMHEKTFAPFKNKFAGKEVAIIACGPSLNNYTPLPNTINIGVNRSYKHPNLKIDYLFLQDASSWSREEMQSINSYNQDACIKFYGIACERLHNDFPAWIVSESDALEANALRYRTSNAELVIGIEPTLPLDISTQPLAEFNSVVFSAIQFALWTNPKRIYLVGCDCSTNGHFYETTIPNTIDPLVKRGYQSLKKFAAAFYPDTEIISINPVGLKGLFKDVYQTQDAK